MRNGRVHDIPPKACHASQPAPLLWHELRVLKENPAEPTLVGNPNSKEGFAFSTNDHFDSDSDAGNSREARRCG